MRKPKLFRKREKQKTEKIIKEESMKTFDIDEYEQKHKEVMQMIHDFFDDPEVFQRKQDILKGEQNND
jgi:hypothetical protein